MQIHYCHVCRLRLTDEQIKTGEAIKTSEGVACRGCVPDSTLETAPGPAAAPLRRPSRRPGTDRHNKAPQAEGMSTGFKAGVAGLSILILLLAGLLIGLLMQEQEAPVQVKKTKNNAAAVVPAPPAVPAVKTMAEPVKAPAVVPAKNPVAKAPAPEPAPAPVPKPAPVRVPVSEPAAAPVSAGDTKMLCNFEDAAALQRWYYRLGKGNLSKDSSGITEGSGCMKVVLEASDRWPAVGPKDKDSRIFCDWSGFKTFKVDMYNPSRKSLELCISFADANSSPKGNLGLSGHSRLVPSGKSTFTFDLKPIKAKDGHTLDWKLVNRMHFFLDQPKEEVTLYLDNMRLEGKR